MGFRAVPSNRSCGSPRTVLVILLAAHLSGGLRLLAIEFLPWHPWQKTWIALAAGAALTVGLLFLLNVV